MCLFPTMPRPFFPTDRRCMWQCMRQCMRSHCILRWLVNNQPTRMETTPFFIGRLHHSNHGPMPIHSCLQAACLWHSLSESTRWAGRCDDIAGQAYAPPEPYRFHHSFREPSDQSPFLFGFPCADIILCHACPGWHRYYGGEERSETWTTLSWEKEKVGQVIGWTRCQVLHSDTWGGAFHGTHICLFYWTWRFFKAVDAYDSMFVPPKRMSSRFLLSACLQGESMSPRTE